ncbi:MAG: SRPBCC family protein [Vicinamibacterales bacterium]
MDIDVTQHLGTVTREVASRDQDGKPAKAVIVSRTYDTTPADLWDAFTTAERLPRWFLPISGDLRPGGRYQLQGNAGGEILVCDPPRHLKLTWEFGGQTSWVEVRIAKHGSGSRLTLEHLVPVDDHWNQYGPGATGVGWDLALVGLTQHVAAVQGFTAEAGMQWMMSENGKSFVRGSSDAWGRANIASGTDEATAAAAVSRTTAAYTGV